MARGIIASFLGMFVLACSGCGGGGGSASPPPVAQSVQKKTISIAMFGDSTMVGYTYPTGPCGPTGVDACAPPQTSIITPNNAPANMVATLNLMGHTVDMTNYALSSTAIEDLMNGNATLSILHPWKDALPTVKGQIIVINYAINDTVRSDENPQQYGALLSQWVDSVRAAGLTPVLEEPNPVCRPGYEAIDSYVAAMDAVSKEKSVALISQYNYLKSLSGWQSMLSDCMHPTPAMYEIKGQREAQVIGPLVADLGG